MGPLFIFLIPLVAALFYAFYNFDRLVDHERINYHDDWIADGRPSGMFPWSNNEKETVLGRLFANALPDRSLAKTKVSFIWVFKTPIWAKTDLVAQKILVRFRWSVAIWIVGYLVWVSIFLCLYT